MTFAAKYHGKCASCGDSIAPGDDVLFVDDVLVHAGCEDAALTVAVVAGREVCTECFTIRPCACDDGQGPVAA